MMIIRREQLDALSEGHFLDFENLTAEWLGRHFPEECCLLGANATRLRIRDALQVAARYRFVSQYDMARFVYLWFMLGPHFDLSPEYSWLEPILKSPAVNSSVRLDNAFQAVMERLEPADMEDAI